MLSGGGDQDSLAARAMTGSAVGPATTGSRATAVTTRWPTAAARRFDFGGHSGHDVVTDITARVDHLAFTAPVTASIGAAAHLLLVHAGGSVEIIGASLESWSASAGAWLV